MLQTFETPVGPDVVRVPAGRFHMGSDAGRPDERPVHLVEVRAFSLARTPVTRGQYEPFLRAGGAAAPPWWGDPAFGDPGQPVPALAVDRHLQDLREDAHLKLLQEHDVLENVYAVDGRIEPETGGHRSSAARGLP